jgi:hypothetical protein
MVAAMGEKVLSGEAVGPLDEDDDMRALSQMYEEAMHTWPRHGNGRMYLQVTVNMAVGEVMARIRDIFDGDRPGFEEAMAKVAAIHAGGGMFATIVGPYGMATLARDGRVYFGEVIEEDRGRPWEEWFEVVKDGVQ